MTQICLGHWRAAGRKFFGVPLTLKCRSADVTFKSERRRFSWCQRSARFSCDRGVRNDVGTRTGRSTLASARKSHNRSKNHGKATHKTPFFCSRADGRLLFDGNAGRSFRRGADTNRAWRASKKIGSRLERNFSPWPSPSMQGTATGKLWTRWSTQSRRSTSAVNTGSCDGWPT